MDPEQSALATTTDNKPMNNSIARGSIASLVLVTLAHAGGGKTPRRDARSVDSRSDAPRGLYALEPRMKVPMLTSRGAAPSCGPKTDAFVTNVAHLEITYGDQISINGRSWEVDEVAKDQVRVLDREIMKPYLVSVVFGRTSKATADGAFSVVSLGEDGVARCADNVAFTGAYSTR